MQLREKQSMFEMTVGQKTPQELILTKNIHLKNHTDILNRWTDDILLTLEFHRKKYYI